MKSLFTFFFLLFLPVFSWGQGIIFQDGSWAEVKAMAKETGKPIFLDTYTTWCAPCKLMDKNLFPDKKVGQFYNANYLCYKMDIEKGDGIDFAKQYKIRSVPSLYFFSSDGKMIHKSVGRPIDTDSFIQIGKDALNPERRLQALTRKFQMGNREPDFLYDYAVALHKAEEPAGEVVDLYLKTQDKADWPREKNWRLILNMVEDFESETFQYVAGNQEALRENAVDSLDLFLGRILKKSIRDVARGREADRREALEKTIRVAFPKQATPMVAKLNYLYYQEDPKEAHAYAVAYLGHHATSDHELNSAAWKYYENETDAKRLESALTWVERSIEIKKYYANSDTRAALLLKLKRYPEAIKAAQEAIELGKQSGTETRHTEKLMEKILEESTASGAN